MLEWSTFKPGRLYVFMDPRGGSIGGFASREEGDLQWKAIGPSTSLSPGKSPDSFVHHHSVLGEFDSLEEAKKEVEARTRSGDYSSEEEVGVDTRHI